MLLKITTLTSRCTQSKEEGRTQYIAYNYRTLLRKIPNALDNFILTDNS